MLLALVGAGTATAAKMITGAQIANGTVTGADIMNGTVKNKDLSAGAKAALQDRPACPAPPARPAPPAPRARQARRRPEPLRRGQLGRPAPGGRQEHRPDAGRPSGRRHVLLSFPEGDRPTSGAANGTSSDTLVMLQIQAGGGLPFGCPAAANVMIRTYDVGLGIYQDNAFRLILSNN